MNLNENGEGLIGVQVIEWMSPDISAVHAFYESIGRPAVERVLLMRCPENMAEHEVWLRRCLADVNAMQKRACPSCGL